MIVGRERAARKIKSNVGGEGREAITEASAMFSPAASRSAGDD